MYSTYLGGTGYDFGSGVAVDGAGNAIVAGSTHSSDFPAANSDPDKNPQTGGTDWDGFIVKVNAAGTGPAVYSRYLGASAYDQTRAVAVDANGNAYTAGVTITGIFPNNEYYLTTWGFDPIGATLSNVTISSYQGDAVAVDASGNVYLAGTRRPFVPNGPDFAAAAKLNVDDPRIEILPTTTRWKPQRDTTAPITVNFKGPNDLDPATVRLEVMPPAGFFGTYTPTKTAVTKITGTDDQYTFDWTGPWTFEPSPGTVMPMPRGSYSLVVFGKRSGSDTEIKNETPFDKVSLVEMTSIRLQAVASALDGNPGPGGGMRIFPEADAPAPFDDVGEKDQVAIVAALDPVIPAAELTAPVRVYFRSLDVDDPSANTPPIDDETRANDNCVNPSIGPPDPNCASGPSGILFDPAESSVGGDGDAGVPIAATGDTATVRLVVSMTQGDNYRVAASTSDVWLQSLNATPSSANGEVVHTSGASLTEGTHFTQMLTVWRTVHLELDYLDSTQVAQDYFDLTGTSSKLQPTELEDRTGPFRPKGQKRPCDHCDNGDWLGADLWPRDPFPGQPVTPTRPSGVFKVTDSRKDKLKVANTDDLMQAPAATGDPYRLRDDYWADLNRALPLELTKEWLTRAYIVLESVEALNLRPTASFGPPTRNLSADSLARFGDPKEPDDTRQRDVPNSDRYWSIMALTAFDPFVVQSCDPCGKIQSDGRSKSFGTLGETVGGGSNRLKQDAGQPVFSVFLETIRDRREGQPKLASCASSFEGMLEIVTAHEVLAHSMGLGSGANTLTDEQNSAAMSCAADPRARQLSEEQLALLRKVRAPRVNPE